MKGIKRLLDLYINASFPIAIAILCLLQVGEFTFGYSSNFYTEAFVFSGTLVGYNFLKYFEHLKTSSFLVKDFSYILAISILATMVTLYSFIQLNLNIQLAYLMIVLLVLLYPFLRKYWYFKMFLVGICLALASSFVPLLGNIKMKTIHYIYLFQQFLFVIAWFVPFEIVDSKEDPFTLHTLPQQYGVLTSKRIGYALLLAVAILQFLFFNTSFNFIPFIVFILLGFAIYFTSFKRNKYYTSFWLESLPVLWWVLLEIGT